MHRRPKSQHCNKSSKAYCSIHPLHSCSIISSPYLRCICIFVVFDGGSLRLRLDCPIWGGIEWACICQLLILLWDIKLRASVAHLTPLFSHRCSRKLDSWMHPHYYWGLTRIVNNDVLASTNICLRFALPIPCPNRSFFGAPSPDRSW